MAYIGKAPVNGFHTKQSLTGDNSTTSFALSFTVADPSSLIVSVGGVLQEPGVAYSLSGGGTNIVFSAAPSSTDTVYVHYLGTAIVQNLQDVNGSEFILDLDGDTSITADTDDQIDFKLGGTDKVRMSATALSPSASDGTALGTSALEWSDLFLADGAVINFGDDQDITLTHNADAGLTLNGVLVTTGLTIGSAAITEAELEILDGLAATTAELTIIDGDTAATSTTLADADRVVVNDNGTMVQVALTDFETYFESSLDTLSSVTTVGALNAGSITSGFGTIDTGSSAITSTGVITGGTVEVTTDTAAGDNAAIGYTAAEGLILTGQGSTSDITIKNDADADVFTVATGTTTGTFAGTVLAKTDTDATNTGSVTLDFTANQNFVLTLTGNVTLANPTTEQVGQSGFIAFIQDGTGSRTVSLGTDYETAAAAGLTLTSTASATDLVPYLVVASGRILLGTPQLAFA